MTNNTVKLGRDELQAFGLPVTQGGPGLAQAEQVEVVDQEGRVEQQQPARQVEGRQGQCRPVRRDVPDDAAHRHPVVHQEREADRRQQYIGAALCRGRNITCQPALEGRPGHAAVLDRENGQEQPVDEQCRAERGGRRRVDGLRDEDIADKADGVEKSDKKDCVAQYAVSEYKCAFHGGLL